MVFLAGICGGIVGKHIPDYLNIDEYYNANIGIEIKEWNLKWELFMNKPSRWIFLEHAFFWLGVIPLALKFIFVGQI